MWGGRQHTDVFHETAPAISLVNAPLIKDLAISPGVRPATVHASDETRAKTATRPMHKNHLFSGAMCWTNRKPISRSTTPPATAEAGREGGQEHLTIFSAAAPARFHSVLLSIPLPNIRRRNPTTATVFLRSDHRYRPPALEATASATRSFLSFLLRPAFGLPNSLHHPHEPRRSTSQHCDILKQLSIQPIGPRDIPSSAIDRPVSDIVRSRRDFRRCIRPTQQRSCCAPITETHHICDRRVSSTITITTIPGRETRSTNTNTLRHNGYQALRSHPSED